MPTQGVIWTVLPNGRSGDLLRFSVHVAPRLRTGGPDLTLADFPDWTDWPGQFAERISFQLIFEGPGLTLPPIDVAPLPQPDSARWTGLFPPSTPVRDYQPRRFDCIRINSYPLAHIAEFMRKQYGTFGALHPEQFPPYADLVADSAFGPIGFEDVGDDVPPSTTGPERRKVLRAALEASFNTDCSDPASGPDTWALPFVPAANSTPAQIGHNFVQVEKYLRRDVPSLRDTPLPPLEVPVLDFHEQVAFSREYRALSRLLGLVLDFEVAVPPPSATVSTRVRLGVSWTPTLGDAAKTNATPYTQCSIGPTTFVARPRAGSDLRGRLLRLDAAGRFEVVLVDADGAAVRAMQFADNVTRSRITVTLNPTTRRKRSLRTPDRFALPALSTGGIAVGRRGRANRLAHTNKRTAELEGQLFVGNGDPAPGHAELYLDDLTRGHRWDVLDVLDGRWRSLMERTGEYRFLDADLKPTDTVPITEETSVVTAAGTSGVENDPGHLYLPETMVKWRGWSLAARQLGKITPEDGGAPVEQENRSEGVRFEAHFDARPGSLPRLRFGRRYRFRARAVDIAGNSLLPTEDSIAVPGTTTAAVTFRRFEPIEAPRVLLRHRAGPGDWTTRAGDPGASAEWAVIRSEGAADPTATTSERHVVPPRSAQRMAEWHGKFDLGSAGQPMDAAAWADIAAREAASLESLGVPEDAASVAPSSYFFDLDDVPIQYLGDPLAKRAFLRGLPPKAGAPNPTETYIAFEDPTDPQLTWPRLGAFRIVLLGGNTATWELVGRTLNVTVPQGDIYTVRLGCAFDPNDLQLMGLWPWVRDAAGSNGVDVPSLRKKIGEGRHWMFTPTRTLTLVHAVRTPLLAPVFVELSPVKEKIGDTAVRFTAVLHDLPSNFISCSRKSTNKLDVTATWQMPVDRGPNALETLPVVPGSPDDPTVPREFQSPAFTVAVDRAGGADPPGIDLVPINARDEFGDTKYRSATYRARATSAFTEHFREQVELTLEDSLPTTIPVPYEPSTVKVKDIPDTGATFRIAADRGPFDPAAPVAQQRLTALINANPPLADYVLDDTAHSLRRTAHGSAPNDDPVAFSFVRPQIHTESAPVTVPILNSSRPAAPDVVYVLPAFVWETDQGPATPYTSTRVGGYLRVYLQRPWWSSGDGEKLGVVLSRGPVLSGDPADDPPPELRPFVTMWGFDPSFLSAGVPVRPKLSSFPLATANGFELAIEESLTRPVDVAGHDVGFDFARGLWYADIRVVADQNTEVKSYFPFVRLALARYQPNSISGAHLSRVVLADFIQLSPTRSASITGTGSRRRVTVTGHSYLRNDAQSGPSQMHVFVERARPDVPDENLRWERLPGRPTVLKAVPGRGDPTSFVWSGVVPTGSARGAATRLVVEEVEVHRRDTAQSAPQVTRVVHTDILPVT